MRRATIVSLATLLLISCAGIVGVLADDRTARRSAFEAVERRSHESADLTQATEEAASTSRSRVVVGAADDEPVGLGQPPRKNLALPGSLPSLGPLPSVVHLESVAMREARAVLDQVEARFSHAVAVIEAARRRGALDDEGELARRLMTGMEDLAEAAAAVTARLSDIERLEFEGLARHRLLPLVQRISPQFLVHEDGDDLVEPPDDVMIDGPIGRREPFHDDEAFHNDDVVLECPEWAPDDDAVLVRPEWAPDVED